MPNRIRELREAAGLTQQNLADRVRVSKVTISELERDKMRLDIHYMRRISQALGVLPADLLQDVDNPHRLSTEEQQVVDRLRQMTTVQRQTIVNLTKVIVESEAQEPPRSERGRLWSEPPKPR